MLPRVKINFENGALGGMAAIDDGVIGLIMYGHEIPTKYEQGSSYKITSLDDLASMGITAALNDDNAPLYAQVSDIYAEAPVGTVVWLMCSSSSSDILSRIGDAKNLLRAAGGAISILVFGDGDSASPAVVAELQAVGVWAADVLFAPVLVLMGTSSYSAMYNPSTYQANRVCAVMGGGNVPCVGLLAGRIAAIPVHRSVARVKDGMVKKTSILLSGLPIDGFDLPGISDAGYISFRTFVGKGGYYFTDDKTATDAADDYSSIARRRTIDKAYRIAYGMLVNELSSEIAVTNEGAISAPIAKSIQNAVETAIENGMAGSLGVDPGDAKDTGVQCYIDVNQNIVSTGKLNVSLRIKPFGYAKYIDLSLGFKTTTT